MKNFYLYLTTQLMEFGVPAVVALNQMDIVAKRGYQINSTLLSENLGMPVVEVSALRGDGIDNVMDVALKAAKDGKAPKAIPFSDDLEQLKRFCSACSGGSVLVHDVPTAVRAVLCGNGCHQV